MGAFMPTVSVIIPTYNRSSLVTEAVGSVLQQTHTDVEVIVVDDGSTDDTRSTIEQISDERVKYYYKDNGGRCTARNYGLIKAQGDYITFLDHDDLWPPEFLQIFIDRFDKNPDYDAVYTRVIVHGPDGIKTELGSRKRLESGWLTKNFFYSSPCFSPSAMCFRASVWKDTFWDEKLSIASEDYDVFLRISTEAKFLFVPDTHLIKREHTDIAERNSRGDDNLIYGALALERFYFHLGGDKYISKSVLNRKISHRFRGAGRINESFQNRCAAILLFRKAISYYPFDIRLYFDILRAWCQSKKQDKKPDWQMPEALPSYITVTRGK